MRVARRSSFFFFAFAIAFWSALVLVLTLGSWRQAFAAEPPDPKTLPDALKPWTAWVLDGHEDALCATFLGRQDVARCLWPARLQLDLDEHGGRFTQSWHADIKGWAPLPGDAKRWPKDVRIDGKSSVIVTANGGPSIQLDRGDHTVVGAFAWDAPPESLRVPPETGLLTLRLRGKEIAAPNRDAEGTVWLQKTGSNEEGNALELVVHRKITDDIPLMVTTHIELHVSGKSREEVLGKSLLAGFVPTALDSQLPARLEPDGRVRVQVRPGIFTLSVSARGEGAIHALTRPDPEGPWREGDEVWVFESKNDYRVVTITGAPSIDPEQTTLPAEWKRLPAYPMKVGSTLTLVETRRGDADPPPNQLSLTRSLWLDFDGTGYTATDKLTGSLTRDARLNMAAPTLLGRVAIGGKDQFITRIGAGGESGVEVRQGVLDVSADSRIPTGTHGDVGDIPAVSWAHDFHQVAGELHLPPGWRLLHASGVDEVPGTWVRHWSLLELFVAMLIGIAIARLYGPTWGAISMVMLALTFPEDGAPKWSWVAVLVLEALFRALPAGKIKALASGARTAAALVVALIAITFLVQHVRAGLHPALAHEDAIVGSNDRSSVSDVMMDEMTAAPASPPPPVAEAAPAPAASGQVGGAPAAPRAFSRNKASNGYDADSYKSITQVYDPTSVVQTGPGLPRWSWTTLPLKWSGPVTATQRLHLYLLSPATNLVLAFVRAALLLLVLFRLLPWTNRLLPRGLAPAAAAMTVIALAFVPTMARADTTPSKEILDELQSRLLRKPACLPSCASSGRMQLDVRDGTLRARIEVDAAASTAIPLPGRSPQWSPSQVMIDGKAASALARLSDGTLWIALPPGTHQIVVEGATPDGASMQLALPLKPHRVEATAAGWSIAGIHEDGLADDDLQLTRVDTSHAGAGAALQPGALPPFVRVERTLQVGLDWQVQTRVVRVTPPGSAVVLEVPLLPGESVTTADVRVAAGKALVNLGPTASEVSWKSVLEQRSPVVLTAPSGVAWVEVWRVDVGPVWHASFKGIPFVHTEPVNGLRIPEWRPWPGEEARVELVRPDGVPGQTLTIDESTLDVTPGLRATDVTLSLSVRSSRGAQHTITLPEEAQLESLTIENATQPIRQDGRKVTIPVTPGAQHIVLTWREPRAIAPMFTASGVDLGSPSVNASIVLHVPQGRWLLFTRGPRVGPAILFWSLLLVLVVVSIALGRNTWTPLRSWHWLLLLIGLSQIHVVAGAVVVGWLIALGWRARNPGDALSAPLFDLGQLVLIGWTLVALVLLCVSIYQGLLGAPAMQVCGNGSSVDTLRWFVDRSDATLPTPSIVSVPILVYRVAMLAWALWIARALLSWVKWGWGAFTAGGGWRKAPPRPVVLPATYPAQPAYPPYPQEPYAQQQNPAPQDPPSPPTHGAAGEGSGGEGSGGAPPV